MVSKARLDLPEPESPVTTTRLLRGISTEMFLRLWTRAPCTAIVVRTPPCVPENAVARVGVGRGFALVTAGCVGQEEGQLLQRYGTALGGADRGRRLDQHALISQVFARRRRAVDPERARKVALDVAGGANLAGITQVIQQRGEQSRSPRRDVVVRGRQRTLHRLPGLLRIQQVRVNR